MRLEMLSENQTPLFKGVISKKDDECIWVSHAEGSEVPPVVYNSRVRLKGYKKDDNILMLCGTVFGSTPLFWKIGQVSEFSIFNKRENYRHPVAIVTTARRLPHRPGEEPEDYAFIPARVTDNTALLARQPDYLKTLEALPPKLRRAWLEGRWDIMEGQVFQEFTDDPAHYEDRQWTHVIRPFDVPREWSVYRSYDFGYAKPFSCGWWAVDHDGCVYRIAELYGCTATPNEGVLWTPDKQFAEIRRIEEEHPLLRGRQIQGVADPAIWDASRGESIYETALKHRIFFVKGDNRRIAGWMQMHYRMSFDEQGYPMLYVFENCRAFIRTVPALLYSQTAPEDVDTSQEDHVADESRYFCMTRPIAPVRAEAREVAEDPLETAEITIPEKFDKVYAGYNEIQKAQGLDLSKYRRKTVMRYTYEVKNYDGYNGGRVLANVIVYRGRVIGGDICSADPQGFVHGFEGAIKMQ